MRWGGAPLCALFATGDAQGCKPTMLCNPIPHQLSWVGGGKRESNNALQLQCMQMFAGARIMQTRTESAIQGHCNLAHIYQPLCQHWLTNTRYLAHWKICAAPQLHNVGLWGNHKLFQQANQSQHNRSTAMQWEGAPPVFFATGDAQGCKPNAQAG